MKRWLVLLLTAVLLFSLAACGSSSETDSSQAAEATEAESITLTSGGVSIDLPAGYTVADNPEGNPNLVATFSGEQGFIVIYVIRESLSDLGVDADFAAKEYMTELHDALTADHLSQVDEKDGLPYFTYTEDSGGTQPLNYLNIGYRSGDYCYVVQFLCYEQEYEPYYRDSFFEWASTVKFE